MSDQTRSAVRPPAQRSREPAPRPFRVLVADDHPLVLDGLVRALLDDGRFEVVGQASDGASAIVLADELGPDLAVLDVRMPGMDGLQAMEAIVEHVPRTRVVLLSAFDDELVITSAVAAGAAGYVLKDTDRRTICDALARVAGGETVLPEAGPRPERPSSARPELTLRERNVLLLVGNGWDHKLIASWMDLEPEDVDWYLSRAFVKLGVDEPDRAVLSARACGLLP
ncbi:response regulator transcription factor [Baekduia soli]|nr:response regulator transcription factor [Baekduia soli]